MPQTFVSVQHDDGRTYRAEVLAQYRIADRWRVRVRYSTAPGITFEHARWADELRPLAQSSGWAGARDSNALPG